MGRKVAEIKDYHMTLIRSPTRNKISTGFIMIIIKEMIVKTIQLNKLGKKLIEIKEDHITLIRSSTINKRSTGLMMMMMMKDIVVNRLVIENISFWKNYLVFVLQCGHFVKQIT